MPLVLEADGGCERLFDEVADLEDAKQRPADDSHHGHGRPAEDVHQRERELAAPMADVARSRLQAERSSWRKDRPSGFTAKPEADNLFHWDCKIPAKETSVWAPGLFKLTMKFPKTYPVDPPVCSFEKVDGKPLFHPNVYPDGKVCLNIINPPQEGGDWKAGISVRQILTALQTFLDEPNIASPAQEDAFKVFKKDRKTYEKKVKAQVAKVDTALV